MAYKVPFVKPRVAYQNYRKEIDVAIADCLENDGLQSLAGTCATSSRTIRSSSARVTRLVSTAGTTRWLFR